MCLRLGVDPKVLAVTGARVSGSVGVEQTNTAVVSTMLIPSLSALSLLVLSPS